MRYEASDVLAITKPEQARVAKSERKPSLSSSQKATPFLPTRIILTIT